MPQNDCGGIYSSWLSFLSSDILACNERSCHLSRCLKEWVQLSRASLFRAVALVQQTPTSAPDTRGLAPWQAQKTIALIDEHLAGRTGITQLAANVRLS